VRRHSELTDELAAQRLANSSLSFLSAALLICGITETDDDVPARYCERCGAEIAHLSDLPSYKGGPATRVFRCYDCDNVVSEEIP
jgi:hypothetical protein